MENNSLKKKEKVTNYMKHSDIISEMKLKETYPNLPLQEIKINKSVNDQISTYDAIAPHTIVRVDGKVERGLTERTERLTVWMNGSGEAKMSGKTKTLEVVQNLLDAAEKKLTSVWADGKALPITKLSKELALEFNIEDPQQVYHLLSLYKNCRKDVYIKNGPRGGLALKENKSEEKE